MRNPFFRRRNPTNNSGYGNPIPGWIRFGMLIFVIYVVVNGHGQKPGEVNKPVAVAKQTVQGVAHIADYTKHLIPDFSTPLNTKDLEVGTGAQAFCGQEVSVQYDAYLANALAGDAPVASATESQPLVFHLGDGKVPPALEYGTEGMKIGGKRSIVAASGLAYGNKDFALPNIPANAQIRFVVKLLGAKPELPNPASSPFRVATIHQGAGNTISCGKPAKIALTVWDLDGKKIYSTLDKGQQPISFTPGKSEVFLGLELGTVGMTQGAQRTLIVPPAYQRPMYGDAPAHVIPLPDKQTVLVDVEALP